jgi:chromosome segregation ATPase
VAETKFQCPQCDQKILVDSSASGVSIDCPYCCSTLVIPASGAASVVVEVRRQFAVLGGTQAGLYQIIEEQRQKLRAESEELARLRAAVQPAQSEIQHLRSDLASALREREAIAARIAAAEVLREASGGIQVQLAQLREENAGLKASQDELGARAARAEESSRGIGERLISNERERSELKAQITLLQTRIQRTQVVDPEVVREPAGRSEAPAGEDARLRDIASREATDLQRQLEVMRAERDAARAEGHVAQATRDEIRARLSEREAVLIKTSLAAEAARHDLDRLRLAAAANVEEKSRLQESAAALQQENGGLRQRLDELLGKLRACEQHLEAALAMSAAVVAERDAARDQAREQKAALDEAVAKCASACLETSRLENAVATISTAHEKTRRESFAIQQHASLVENGLRVREKELQAARESADLDKSEQAGAQERMNALETELRDLREQLIRATDAEQTYKTLIEDTDRVLNESHAQVKALSAELDRLASASSHAAGSGVPSEFDRLRANHDRLQASVLCYEEQLEQNTDTIQMIEAERDQFKAELDLLRSASGRSGAMIAEPVRRTQISGESAPLPGL